MDALLQGRVKGMALVDQIRQSGVGRPGDRPDRARSSRSTSTSRQGIHGVLTMPFSGYELINNLQAGPQRRPTSDADRIRHG